MIADRIPANVRGWIYTILATVFGIEAVLNLVDDGIETKVLGVLAVLGFALARVNTRELP